MLRVRLVDGAIGEAEMNRLTGGCGGERMRMSSSVCVCIVFIVSPARSMMPYRMVPVGVYPLGHGPNRAGGD